MRLVLLSRAGREPGAIEALEWREGALALVNWAKTMPTEFRQFCRFLKTCKIRLEYSAKRQQLSRFSLLVRRPLVHLTLSPWLSVTSALYSP